MSINGVQNTSFPLTLSGLTLTDDLSGTYIPYAGAISAINLNNQAVSNVASLAVVGAVSSTSVSATGAVSGASVSATGAISGNSLAITNNTGTNTLVVGSSASIANLTATGNNAISNLTTTGSLTSGGPVICNNTTAIGYWLPSNGTTSIYITDTSANVATPATTLSRYFATGGAVYQDFYGSFNWRATTGLNNALTTTVMSLTNTTLTVSANLNVTGTSNVLTVATNNNSTNVATTAFVNNFAIPIAGLCTGVNTTLRLLNALTTAVFRITSHDGVNIFQVYYTSGVPEVICSSLQVATTGEFRALGNCNLGATTCTTLTASGALSQTGGTQTFALGAYGSSGDYIVPTTNIYGSTVFDGFNGVNLQCQASQYGRNILFLTGRYESSNDGWTFAAPRNAIIFRTQATLNATATLRYTIQNYFNELGILCAGKSNVPITKWANDGTMTHTDDMSIGGLVTLTKTGDGILKFANNASLQAKNSGGTYENFLWARASDNIMYINYGAGGFHIRNNASTTAMFLNNAGNVGIGHSSPICTMDFKGTANIWAGTRYAVSQGFMSAGSLTIGDITADFGGGTNWNSNTAGLLMECLDNTEIAVHNAGNTVNSIVQYIGGLQRLRFGRSMLSAWGETPSMFDGTLYCVADTALSLRSTYGQLVVSNGYNNNSIIHRHDGSNYYMLISNGVYDTTWNSLRPFRINISSGQLVSDNTQFFRGGCNIERDTPSGSHGNSALYVTANTGDSLIECRHSNGSQGVGIAYNSIFATGYNADQDLNISARGGNGRLRLSGGVTLNSIARQTATGSVLTINSSNNVEKSQLSAHCFQSFNTNWGGGVTLGTFGKTDQMSAVVISGYVTYYTPGGGNQTVTIRLYNNSTGGYYYYSQTTYTNVVYNHVSYPINNIASGNDLPAGVYTVYVYISGGSYATDTNDNVNLMFIITP